MTTITLEEINQFLNNKTLNNRQLKAFFSGSFFEPGASNHSKAVTDAEKKNAGLSQIKKDFVERLFTLNDKSKLGLGKRDATLEEIENQLSKELQADNEAKTKLNVHMFIHAHSQMVPGLLPSVLAMAMNDSPSGYMILEPTAEDGVNINYYYDQKSNEMYCRCQYRRFPVMANDTAINDHYLAGYLEGPVEVTFKMVPQANSTSVYGYQLLDIKTDNSFIQQAMQDKVFTESELFQHAGFSKLTSLADDSRNDGYIEEKLDSLVHQVNSTSAAYQAALSDILFPIRKPNGDIARAVLSYDTKGNKSLESAKNKYLAVNDLLTAVADEDDNVGKLRAFHREIKKINHLNAMAENVDTARNKADPLRDAEANYMRHVNSIVVQGFSGLDIVPSTHNAMVNSSALFFQDTSVDKGALTGSKRKLATDEAPSQVDKPINIGDFIDYLIVDMPTLSLSDKPSDNSIQMAWLSKYTKGESREQFDTSGAAFVAAMEKYNAYKEKYSSQENKLTKLSLECFGPSSYYAFCVGRSPIEKSGDTVVDLMASQLPSDEYTLKKLAKVLEPITYFDNLDPQRGIILSNLYNAVMSKLTHKNLSVQDQNDSIKLQGLFRATYNNTEERKLYELTARPLAELTDYIKLKTLEDIQQRFPAFYKNINQSQDDSRDQIIEELLTRKSNKGDGNELPLPHDSKVQQNIEKIRQLKELARTFSERTVEGKPISVAQALINFTKKYEEDRSFIWKDSNSFMNKILLRLDALFKLPGWEARNVEAMKMKQYNSIFSGVNTHVDEQAPPSKKPKF